MFVSVVYYTTPDLARRVVQMRLLKLSVALAFVLACEATGAVEGKKYNNHGHPTPAPGFFHFGCVVCPLLCVISCVSIAARRTTKTRQERSQTTPFLRMPRSSPETISEQRISSSLSSNRIPSSGHQSFVDRKGCGTNSSMLGRGTSVRSRRFTGNLMQPSRR